MNTETPLSVTTHLAPLPQLKQRRRKKTILWVIRLCIFVAILSFLSYASPLSKKAAMILSPLLFFAEPTRSLSDLILTQSEAFLSNTLTIVSTFIVTLCIIKRRFFCHYICPIGFCIDLAFLIRKTIFHNRLWRYGIHIHPHFIVTLFAFLWGSITIPVFVDFDFFDIPFSAFTFDPLAIFSRFFVTNSPIPIIIYLIVVCFLLSPLLWRYHICPCGMLQELLFLPRGIINRLSINQASSSTKAPTSLGLIPKREGSTQEKTPATIARRRFFSTSSAVILSILLFETIRRNTWAKLPHFYRPPGAGTEKEYLSRCARCGRCIDACPNKILTFARFNNVSLHESDEIVTNKDNDSHLNNKKNLIPWLAYYNVPIVDFTSGKQYCEKDCIACSQVCPTNAIRSLSLDEKYRSPIALVTFSPEHCMLYYDHECSICRRECPYNAIDFIWNEEEYLNLPTIDVKKCVGCGRCVAHCPGEPLFRENDETIAEGDPIQRVKALSLVMKSH